MKIICATIFLLTTCLLFSACGRETSQMFEIRFDVNIEQVEAQSETKIQHLKFFVYDIELLGTDGEFHRANVVNHAPWQNSGAALLKLDLEQDAAHPSIKVQINEVPERISDEYQGIRFLLGLPADINHQDPLQAESPFNLSSMFWSWQMGHKFFRLDIQHRQQNFAFHLGSTGCKSDSAVRPPASPCTQPNIAKIALMGFDPNTNVIQVNLKTILRHIYIDTHDTQCTGNYHDKPLCRLFIKQLGLSPEQGTCEEDCAKQNLFLVGKNRP